MGSHWLLTDILIYRFLSPLVPEGVPSPFVTDSIPGTVVISWEPPTTPNGIILQYYIQRAPGGTQNFTQLGAILGNVSLVFVDATVAPFTLYKYRIVAVNSVGQTAGPPEEFRTPEAGNSRLYNMLVFENPQLLTLSSLKVT